MPIRKKPARSTGKAPGHGFPEGPLPALKSIVIAIAWQSLQEILQDKLKEIASQ